MDQTHKEYFLSLLGDKGALFTENNITGYETGARGDLGKALCVLRPATTEEVSDTIAYCASHQLHIIPQSGNTGLVGGSVPDDSGTQIVLSLERLNKIFEIDTINQSVHVGGGVRLSSVNTATEEHQLFIPIDLGSDPCIGGMISTNTGGSRFLKYRGMREYTLGLKAVLPDKHGTIIDVLCPLHKNNTGLDAKQLFIGTCGAYGIVTEAIIRLSPLPQQSASALLIPSSPQALNTLLSEIEKSCGTYLSAFEGMSGNAIRAALHHCPSLPSPFGQDEIPEYAVLVELSRSWQVRDGEQSLDDVLENVLGALWERGDDLLENALIGNSDKLWDLRHSLSEGVQKSGKLYAFDISFKRGDLMRFRDFIAEQLAQHYPELTLCDFGHVGDGAMHCSLVLDKNDPRAQDEAYEKTLRAWMNDRAVLDFEGSYSAEHALGRKVQDAYNKYTSDEIRTLTSAIKHAIAPAPIGTVDL